MLAGPKPGRIRFFGDGRSAARVRLTDGPPRSPTPDRITAVPHVRSRGPPGRSGPLDHREGSPVPDAAFASRRAGRSCMIGMRRLGDRRARDARGERRRADAGIR